MAFKKDNDFSYQIDEYIGSLTESSTHDWAKAVLRISWGDSPSSINIRNVNMADKRIGKGINLTNEETDRLVDILLENDFGSLDILEKAIKRKKNFYTIIDNGIENMLNDDDDLKIDINL